MIAYVTSLNDSRYCFFFNLVSGVSGLYDYSCNEKENKKEKSSKEFTTVPQHIFQDRRDRHYGTGTIRYDTALL